MKLTYREAYDRIVTAYLQNKLRPWDDCACFIGNLLGNTSKWVHACTFDSIYNYKHPGSSVEGGKRPCALSFIGEYGYTSEQITELENNFISIVGYRGSNENINEDKLFFAMSSTLDMLKKIHEENGEIVDAPVFTKRQLVI